MVLEINLDRLKEGDNKVEFSAEQLEEVDFEENEVFAEAPLNINLEKRGNYLYCTGSTSVDMNFFCDRCIDEYAERIEIEMEYVFHLGLCSGSNNDNEIIEIPEDERVLFIDEEFKESLELSIPFLKVCHEDCKGLCPICGINLNENTCSCSQTKKIDSRWDKLAEIAEQMKEQENKLK